jgi:hypothetical protein
MPDTLGFLDNTANMHRKDANTRRKLANSVKKDVPQRRQKKISSLATG